MPQINSNWINPTPKRDIKYIYRICDKRMYTNTESISKLDCLVNFKHTFGTDAFVIADGCSKPIFNTLKQLGFKRIVATNLGNSRSFDYALDMALRLEDTDTVYFVEDDYIHHPDALKILNEGLPEADFVTLYDHPDKYGVASPNPLVAHGGELCRVLKTASCHWKETNSTTMTFATRVKNIKDLHETMRKYLDVPTPRDYPMWRDLLFDRTLISPMPSYSTHCHDPWMAPMRNWNDYAVHR